jgi:hypothetical protein
MADHLKVPDHVEAPTLARLPGLPRRLGDYVVVGVLGSLIVRGGVALAPHLAPLGRNLLVGSLATGIRLGRWIEGAAEETRLRFGDLVAEAREQTGEEAHAPKVGVAGHPEGATGSDREH